MYVSEKKLTVIALIGYFLVYFSYLFHPPFVDDGLEFVSVSAVLGIAHPTGYPLYTLSGALWLRLTPFLNPYFSMTVMNFLFSAASFLVIFLLLKKRFSILTALSMSALLFANSQFLLISIRPEVYSLHLLFLSAVLYVLFSTYAPQKKLVLFLFLQGLALTNHITSVFFVLIWLPQVLTFRKKYSLSGICKGALLGISPLLLYLYLPLSSSFNPPINWGNPSTLEGFLWLITGGDYRETYLLVPFVGSALAPEYWPALIEHLKQLFFNVLANIPFLAFFFYLAMKAFSSKNIKKHLRHPIFIGLILYALVLILFMSHYAIPDIYEHLPLLFTVLFFAVISVLPENVDLSKKHLLAVSVMVILSFGLAQLHIPRSHEYYLIEESVQTLPEKSIVVTQGDVIYSLWYMKYALHIRPDLTYIGANFINYPWYASFFEHSDGDVEIRSFEGWQIDDKKWVDRVINGILEPNRDHTIFLFLPDPVLKEYIETETHRQEAYHIPFYKVTGWESPLYIDVSF